MGMRINHLVMIFTTEGQLVWCSAVNSRRLFCGDFGDVFLYLRMFLKVKNQMPKFKCWFLLAGFLLDYLHVNRCYAVGKMVIWLGLIYNVIDLRKYSLSFTANAMSTVFGIRTCGNCCQLFSATMNTNTSMACFKSVHTCMYTWLIHS